MIIETNLSRFVVTMHSGLCKQYVQSLGLTASGLNVLFACALVHCDNKPLQNWSYSLKYHGITFSEPHYSRLNCGQTDSKFTIYSVIVPYLAACPPPVCILVTPKYLCIQESCIRKLPTQKMKMMIAYVTGQNRQHSSVRTRIWKCVFKYIKYTVQQVSVNSLWLSKCHKITQDFSPWNQF